MSYYQIQNHTSEWYTPLDLYRELDEEFHFVTDPCAEPSNRLHCKIFYTRKDNGLEKPWYGNVFVNPPYWRSGKNVGKWVAKCAEYATSGQGTAVMLLPARISNSWFYNYTWDEHKYKHRDGVEFRPIRKRLEFENPLYSVNNSAPFPLMVVVFRGKKAEVGGPNDRVHCIICSPPYWVNVSIAISGRPPG
jgi:phage N-6-adenine-methyltransferase